MLIAFCVQPPAIFLHSGGKFSSCLRAQDLNRSVNGGREDKFPVTLAIVSETLFITRRIIGRTDQWGDYMKWNDDIVASLINELDDENELKMIENVHNHFIPIV